MDKHIPAPLALWVALFFVPLLATPTLSSAAYFSLYLKCAGTVATAKKTTKANVELALRDGYSTIGSMGMGLPGARRLMDHLVIDSAPGRGTTVTIAKWRR